MTLNEPQRRNIDLILRFLPNSFAYLCGVKTLGKFLTPSPWWVTSGVATGWTGVDMSTPLLPKVIPEIDANPMTFLGASGGGRRGVSVKRVGEVIRQSEQLLNF